MVKRISRANAPALGDIRALRSGDVVFLDPTARERPDWARYLDAIAAAVARGVDIIWEAAP